MVLGSWMRSQFCYKVHKAVPVLGGSRSTCRTCPSSRSFPDRFHLKVACIADVFGKFFVKICVVLADNCCWRNERDRRKTCCRKNNRGKFFSTCHFTFTCHSVFRLFSVWNLTGNAWAVSVVATKRNTVTCGGDWSLHDIRQLHVRTTHRPRPQSHQKPTWRLLSRSYIFSKFLKPYSNAI